MRFAYRGMLVAFGLAAVTLLAASGTGSAGTRVIRFEGHGPTVLPHLRITTASTLSWTNSGGSFQILSFGTVSTEYTHGRTRLPAGRYRFFVNAAAADEPDGHWQIVIR